MKFASSLLSLIFCAALSGCAVFQTNAPKPITADDVAWSGTHQDAGIIRAMHAADGRYLGLLVRQSYVDTYNRNAARFGQQLSPPVSPGEGLTPYGIFWIIDPQHAAAFVELNALSK